MADESPSRSFVVRLSGEIGTKAPATRAQFLRALARNLDDALRSAGLPHRIRRAHLRLTVESTTSDARDVIARVFGVQSASQVERRPYATQDDLVAAGHALFREAVAGRRFAVRARRIGERDPRLPDAREVERALGAALLPYAARVDLDHPEFTAMLEIAAGEASFFSERTPGPAGLPLGTQSRALALVSGGFDSAVAAWQLLRRGVALDYLFCNLGGASHELGALRVLKVIADDWSYGTRPKLHAVDFRPLAQELQERTETRYWQVLLKRGMLRAADAVARETGAVALVTGESVGQVSSQTLPNLAVISEATALPILRPLVGANKDEIIAQAGRIGTAALSAVVQEYCALAPRRPATQAALDVVRSQETRLDRSLLDRAVAGRRVHDLRRLDPEALCAPDLERSTLPEGAVVLDLRPRDAFASWHPPDAVRLDFAEALRAYPSFARDRRYLLVCEFGLKSAHLAELMRKEGLEAWSFHGGTRALRRALERGTARA